MTERTGNINQEMCRICLEDENELVVEAKTLQQQIWNIAQIELKDDPDLPDKICEKCLLAVQEANAVREMCLQSHKRLDELLEEARNVLQDNSREEIEQVIVKEEYKIDETNSIKCCLCSHSFEHNDQLMTHSWGMHKCRILKVENTEASKLQCNICLTTFSETTELLEHRTCDICFSTFLSDSELLSHQVQVHNDSETELARVDKSNVKIEISSDESSEKNGPEDDTHTSHNSSKRKRRIMYSCCQCEFRVELMSLMRIHFSKKHESAKKTNPKPSKLACTWCLQEFDTKEARQVHIRSPRNKQFECSICGKIFNTNYKLSLHYDKEHEGTQSYPCDECDRVFAKYFSMKSHKYLQHNEANTFKCDLCEKMFHRKASLVEHLNSHKGVMPFLCSYCPARFPRMSGLRNHIRVHTKEKPYKCKFCEKAYSHFTDVKRHMFSHTGNYPFNCEICKKGFAKKSVLQTHMRSHLTVAERLALQRGEAPLQSSSV